MRPGSGADEFGSVRHVLDIRLLGPLEILVRGAPVRLKRRKQRVLLALLALTPRRVVHTDTIVDSLWREPPVAVRNQVQIHVSAIRTALADHDLPRDLLRTHPHGYCLHLPTGTTDLEKAEALVGAAEAAIAECRYAAAVEALRAALHWWHGSALTDIPEDFARNAAVLLDERRLALLVRKLDLQMAMGRYEEVLAELFANVADHGLDEGMHLRLMVALHRCGRSADALRVYREFRRTLVESLGIEPGAQLRSAQAAILRGDLPDLSSRTTAPHVQPL